MIALLLTGCEYIAPSRPWNGVGIEKASDGTCAVVLHSCPGRQPTTVQIEDDAMEPSWRARREGPAVEDFEQIPIGRPAPGWTVEVDSVSKLDPSTKYFVVVIDPSRPLRGMNFVLNDLKAGLVRCESDISIDEFKNQKLYCSTPTA